MKQVKHLALEPGKEFTVEHNLLETASDKYKFKAQLPPRRMKLQQATASKSTNCHVEEC